MKTVKMEITGYNLKEAVEALKRPDIWPEKPLSVVAKETHMSWVFLTGKYAWKLKKPVSYHFLDFRTLEKREQYCREELRLNRRLAPNIYMDVVPLTLNSQGGLEVGGEGEVVDWLLKMRQLPNDASMHYRLKKGQLTQSCIEEVGQRLTRFFTQAENVPVEPDYYITRFRDVISFNLSELLSAGNLVPRDRLYQIYRVQTDFLDRREDLFIKRVKEKRIIEGHGDLRPEHIYLLAPEPVVIDCIEFNRDLRLLDPINELAFLQMECAMLNNEDAGRQIFEVYESGTDDWANQALIAFYAGVEAFIRARLAWVHLRDVPYIDRPKWESKLHRYLDLAQMYGMRQEGML